MTTNAEKEAGAETDGPHERRDVRDVRERSDAVSTLRADDPGLDGAHVLEVGLEEAMKVERLVTVNGRRFRLCVQSADGETHSWMSERHDQMNTAVDAVRDYLRHVMTFGATRCGTTDDPAEANAIPDVEIT